MFANTERKRRLQLASDLRKKITLENQLRRAINPIFFDVATQFERSIKTTRTLPSLFLFNRKMEETLLKHYQDVQSVFQKDIRVELEKACYFRITTKQEFSLIDEFKVYRTVRSNQQSQIITETTSKDMEEAILLAVEDAQAGNFLTNSKKFAALAALYFENKLNSRIETIAITETNAPAESTKDIDAQIALDEGVVIDGQVITPDMITKTWSAVLDNRTRDAHAEADDQTVHQDESFEVGGEQLNYPGDTSLGASLGNVINCRCNTSRAIDLSGLPNFVYHPLNRA